MVLAPEINLQKAFKLKILEKTRKELLIFS
jgi:hypothetical protein